LAKLNFQLIFRYKKKRKISSLKNI
jgi:hypothetical protein